MIGLKGGVIGPSLPGLLVLPLSSVMPGPLDTVPSEVDEPPLGTAGVDAVRERLDCDLTVLKLGL